MMSHCMLQWFVLQALCQTNHIPQICWYHKCTLANSTIHQSAAHNNTCCQWHSIAKTCMSCNFGMEIRDPLPKPKDYIWRFTWIQQRRYFQMHQPATLRAEIFTLEAEIFTRSCVNMTSNMPVVVIPTSLCSNPSLLPPTSHWYIIAFKVDPWSALQNINKQTRAISWKYHHFYPQYMAIFTHI